jgi:hypothetical protein
MENIKLYGINIAALALTSVEGLVPHLQAISLLLAIVYTAIQIYQKVKNL